MRKYSKCTDNIGSGNFTNTFCQNTDKLKKSGEGVLQCSLIQTDIKLPSHLHYKNENRSLIVNFSIDDIEKVLQNLDSNNAHAHDKISICMLQLCGNLTCKSLELIFKHSVEIGSFPFEWKKENVVPSRKKDDKQCLKNYLPVSLLRICGKMFKKSIFNKMFEFFIENELISPNESGFKPGDSYIYQLLAITHQICKSFLFFFFFFL